MNYNTAFRQLPDKQRRNLLKPQTQGCTVYMRCCGMTEAYVNGFVATAATKNKGNADKALETVVARACYSNKGVIVWSIPGYPTTFWREVREKLEKMPATRNLGSFINPNTGNKLYVFVTFLREEWK